MIRQNLRIIHQKTNVLQEMLQHCIYTYDHMLLQYLLVMNLHLKVFVSD